MAAEKPFLPQDVSMTFLVLGVSDSARNRRIFSCLRVRCIANSETPLLRLDVRAKPSVDDGKTQGPGWWKCTAHYQPEPNGLPLAQGYSEIQVPAGSTYDTFMSSTMTKPDDCRQVTKASSSESGKDIWNRALIVFFSVATRRGREAPRF